MGISTGYDSLDQLLGGGLHNGLLYMLESGRGVEETSLAINMVNNICIREHHSAAFFSLHMCTDQILSRIIALEAQVDFQKLVFVTL